MHIRCSFIKRTCQVIAYGGDPGTVAIQLNDITKRKREEQRLRQIGEVQQELLNLLPHAVYWCDDNGAYAGGNAALCRLLGVSEVAEFVGRQAVEISPGLEAVFGGRSATADQELELVSADGVARTLLSSRVPLGGHGGACVGFGGILHDITVRKQMERELVERKESLEHAVLERTRELEAQLSVVAAQRETIQGSRRRSSRSGRASS